MEQLLEAWQANLNAQRFRLSVSGGKNKSRSLSVGVALPPQFELTLSSATGNANSVGRGNLQLTQKDTEKSNSLANFKLSAHKESSKEVFSFKEPRDEPASTQREEDTSQQYEHHRSHPRGRGGRRGNRGDGDGDGRGAGHGDPNPSGGRGRGRMSDSRYGRGRGRHSHSPADHRDVVSNHAPPPPPPSVSNLMDMNSLFPPLPGRSQPDKDWSCSGCTYLNNASLTYCEMCELKR